MTDVLQTIIQRKYAEVSRRSEALPLAEIRERLSGHSNLNRGFRSRLETDIAAGRAAVIAEIKKASPSKGVIRENFDVATIAQDYREAGASCLSVLTDEDFFLGHLENLTVARSAVDIPLLRKDFIVDPWQLYESILAGADCILLIVAALTDSALRELSELALELGLDVLVEVHDGAELDRALHLSDQCILGVNNRNLRTFHTSLCTSLDLLERTPEGRLLITESGISDIEQVKMLRANGIDGFLVGEALMRAESPGAQLRELFDL